MVRHLETLSSVANWISFPPFVPLASLGLASGQFPRLAASLGLLCRFLAEQSSKPRDDSLGPSHKALTRFRSGLPRFGRPRKRGPKGDPTCTTRSKSSAT